MRHTASRRRRRRRRRRRSSSFITRLVRRYRVHPVCFMPDAVTDIVQAQLPPHFQDAQYSIASHRKNCVSLFRLHVRCAQVTEQTERGVRLVGEKLFNECFFGCLHRILGLKKGMKNADRICKFVATYAAYAIEQFTTSQDDTDTPATRFVSIFLKHLLRGFRAKNKHVRLRCATCVSLLINVIDSIEYVGTMSILTQ